MPKQSLAVALTASLVAGVPVRAANPLVPEATYADPEPRVWADGKLYVYGSHDVGPQQWCSDDYHFLSSSDLARWDDPGPSFTMKQMPPGSGRLLFACDCGFRAGKYYLYVSTDNGTLAVAKADGPTGPFSPATKVGGLPDRPGIDPAVLVDDDGQAYLYWGQFDRVRAAKLTPDMMAVDPATVVQPLSRSRDHFHEGSAVTKRGGTYYYVFADESRGKRPTCLGYATAQSPLGPYTYRGVIIDNKGCDPGDWNDHGRIVQYNGQWYVFHHRSTGNGSRPRQTCAEPITFTPDGLIPEVKMTSRGIGPPVDVTRRTAALTACTLSGNLRVERATDATGLVLGQARGGDVAVFRGIAFGAAPTTFTACCLPPEAGGGTVEVRVDAAAAPPVAVLPVPAARGVPAWQTLSATLRADVPQTGVHDLYLSFRTDRPISLAWFRFGP